MNEIYYTYNLGYHNWYKFVERIIPGQTITQVVKKTILDQSIAAPIVVSTFFVAMGFLDKFSFTGMRKWKLKRGGRKEK
jgi:hypothetical protein